MTGPSVVSRGDAVGTWGTAAPGQPQLTLGTSGVLTGTDGCNRLSGRWELDTRAVAFGDVISTLMFCDGVDTWLSGLSSATIDGDTMQVMNADGEDIGTLAKQPS